MAIAVLLVPVPLSGTVCVPDAELRALSVRIIEPAMVPLAVGVKLTPKSQEPLGGSVAAEPEAAT